MLLRSEYRMLITANVKRATGSMNEILMGSAPQNKEYPPGWTQLADFPSAISMHVAGVFEDHLYVYGGTTGSYSTSDQSNKLWRYDFRTNVWQELSPTGARPPALTMAGGCIANGCFWIYGGLTGSVTSGSLWCLNLSTLAWSSMQSYTALNRQRLIPVGNLLYSIGGGAKSGGTSPTTSVYDTVSDSWRALPNAPFDIVDAGVDYLNGQIWSYGGGNAGGVSSTAYFDITSETWVASDTHAPSRRGLSMTALGDRFFVLGGTLDPGVDRFATLTPNGQSYLWEPIADNLYSLHYHTACRWNDSLVVVGGIKAQPAVNNCWLYRP